jgi:hypothetical protein
MPARNSIPSIFMYDGQQVVGTITIVKEKFVARDSGRRLLGRFKSRKQALNAIERALERADG